MRDIAGRIVALTGAGSGIGRALALELSRSGAILALADIDESGLAGTAKSLDIGSQVSTHVVDVGDREAVAAFADAVLAQHSGCDMLINNAGVSSVATMEETSYEDLEWVLAVNLWGAVYGTKSFLPMLLMSPEAHLVNVGSVNSFLPFPTNGPYNISKAGLDALTGTLMQELAGTSVAVSIVYPGGVKTSASRHARHTSAADHARFEGAVRMTPERAARKIMTGIRKNKPRIVVGADARFLNLATRAFPTGTARLVNRVARGMGAGQPQ